MRTLIGAMLLLLVPGAAATATERLAPPAATASLDGLRDCAGGGVVLPGSDTCLRLGGSVRAETAVRTGAAPSLATGERGRSSLTHLGTSARITLDARTPTAAGPLRVYTSVRLRGPEGGLGH